jgi:hypothetical protein
MNGISVLIVEDDPELGRRAQGLSAKRGISGGWPGTELLGCRRTYLVKPT